MTDIAYVPPTTNYNYNQIGHFRELVVGAGSTVFKANNIGVFAGGASFSSSPFRLSYSGALTATDVTISGTINATAGTISGNLTVTGSLLSDDGSGFQNLIYGGKVAFLKSSVEKAFIKTASDSSSIIIATGSKCFITKYDGTPLAEFDQSSNLTFASDAYIKWGSRKLTASGSKLSVDGDLECTGSFVSDGTSGYSGDLEDSTGTKIADVLGGIITSVG